VTSSCGAGRRDIRRFFRRKGMGDWSLYTLSELRGILRKAHNFNPYAKWRVANPRAPLRAIFCSSPVLTAG